MSLTLVSALAGAGIEASLASVSSGCTAYDRDTYESLIASAVAPVGSKDSAPEGDSAVEPIDDAATEASLDAPDASTCAAGITQQGSWVPLEQLGTDIPIGAGGDLFPGTFTLTALRAHSGAPPGGGEFRETIQILPGTATTDILSIQSLAETRNGSGFYSDQPPTETQRELELGLGSKCYVRLTCPAPDASLVVDPSTYTATPSTLTLFVNPLEYEYTRVE